MLWSFDILCGPLFITKGLWKLLYSPTVPHTAIYIPLCDKHIITQ